MSTFSGLQIPGHKPHPTLVLIGSELSPPPPPTGYFECCVKRKLARKIIFADIQKKVIIATLCKTVFMSCFLQL